MNSRSWEVKKRLVAVLRVLNVAAAKNDVAVVATKKGLMAKGTTKAERRFNLFIASCSVVGGILNIRFLGAYRMDLDGNTTSLSTQSRVEKSGDDCLVLLASLWDAIGLSCAGK